MSDQEKTQETSISPQPDAEDTKRSAELSEEELKKVSGSITITKQYDAASPKLFEALSSGTAPT
jgi:type VI protein secretion system component Hcp